MPLRSVSPDCETLWVDEKERKKARQKFLAGEEEMHRANAMLDDLDKQFEPTIKPRRRRKVCFTDID